MRRLIYIPILLTSLLTHGQKTSSIKYNSFKDFCNKISNNNSLVIDTVQLKDTATVNTKITIDSIQQSFSFRLDNFKIKYVITKDVSKPPTFTDPSYIIFNDKKILPDSIIGFQGLSITRAIKTVLNGSTFFILSSWAPDCNGTFCLAQYDQFFQLKGNEINYQIIEGWQYPANIYCDLNNDGKLDMISFVGDCFSKHYEYRSPNDNGKYIFCI